MTYKPFIALASIARAAEAAGVATRGALSYAVREGRAGRTRRLGTLYLVHADDVHEQFPTLPHEWPEDAVAWFPDDGEEPPLLRRIPETRGTEMFEALRVEESLAQTSEPEVVAPSAPRFEVIDTYRAPEDHEALGAWWDGGLEDELDEVEEPPPTKAPVVMRLSPSAPPAPPEQKPSPQIDPAQIVAAVMQALEGQIRASVAAALDTTRPRE